MTSSDRITLSYDFGSVNAHDTFDVAQPWRGRLGSWDGTLDNGRLSATTADSFESETEARASLEPILRAWEAAAYLVDQHEIWFRAAGSEPGGEASGFSNREHVFRRLNESYPGPDLSFTRTPLVERLLDLIRAYTAGSLELPIAAGELLSALDSAPREEGASIADAYNIDPAVIETLTEMAARHADSQATGQAAYRGPEWQWMQEALRLLTLQAGRRTSEPPAARLAMEDFRTRL
jgi:hypothetical protein